MGVAYKPGDARYVHDQPVSLTPWVISHGLGKFPGVTLVDSDMSEIEADVRHDSLNQVTVTFAVPVAGKAFLS